MKTSYNILWIDDDLDSTDVDQDEIRDFFEEFGIYANIDPVEALDDGSVHQMILRKLESPDLDLILVDFHMDGLNGADLIKLIRQTDHVYLPVIFYSSAPVDTLFSSVSDNQLDGVYVTNRDFLLVKFREVIKSLLAKEHTTKRTRGLLMEGVSEIDAKFMEVYKLLWIKMDDISKTKFLEYIKKEIINKSFASKPGEILANYPDSTEALEEHLILRFMEFPYDTFKRSKMIKAMLKIVGDSDSASLVSSFIFNSDGNESLNGLRNKYAHKTRQMLDEEHTVEKCIGIRKAIRSHSKNIDDILSDS